ncbi:MAG: exodeoxyribonuclease III [Bdellovibrionales bacterium]|jgi:exodeoxyribonuclease-3|nr:exodeoxyribonuclease III [Bdellovibrionales bacterium]
MKIASWNVNSVNMRLPHVLAWLDAHKPDALLLQELKCSDDKFPLADIESAGYKAAVHGQKSWNGVAILSPHDMTDVRRGLPGDDSDEQSRYIEATIKGFRIASLYLPNGNPVDSEKYPYKLRWFDRLITHAQGLLASGMPTVLGGDYNIIPEARDCHDPAVWADDALFRLESRRKFRSLVHLGYTDAFRAVNDENEQYTFWDYQAGAWPRNHGIRIDHLLLNPQAADRLHTCQIDRDPRAAEKASDHTPIFATFTPEKT